MDIERIERIAEFMSHPGGEQGQGIEAFRLDFFLGHAASLRQVAHEQHKAEVFVIFRAWFFTGIGDGGEVEIKEPAFRIKQLEVAADRA